MASGLAHLQKGHGVAFADFDHDGDQDVFVEIGGAFPGDAFANAVFENQDSETIGSKFKLVVKLRTGWESAPAFEPWWKKVQSPVDLPLDQQRRVFGANPLRAHIGLGKATQVTTLEVYWPTATRRNDLTTCDQPVPPDHGRT